MNDFEEQEHKAQKIRMSLKQEKKIKLAPFNSADRGTGAVKTHYIWNREIEGIRNLYNSQHDTYSNYFVYFITSSSVFG